MSLGIVGAHYVDAGGGGGGYAGEVLADSPAFYWKCEDTSGTSATDSSGNSKPGTISGSPTLGAATVMPSGTGAFTLDSTSKFIQIAEATAPVPSPPFTVEAWVRMTATSSYHAIINRDGSGSNRGWNIYVTDGKLNGYDGSTDHKSTGATLSTGTAYHVAATCDGTTVKLYLNGSLDFSFTAAAGWLIPGSASVNGITVGASFAGIGSLNFPLTGDIDHIAYYPTVLSAGRIAAHYAAR